MLLQIIQNVDSLDSLSQTGGQNQTELGLLVVVLFLVVTFLVWIITRKRPVREKTKEPQQEEGSPPGDITISS